MPLASFLPRYLRRHRKDDDTAYVIGGAAGLFAFLIVLIFGLAATDTYFLRNGSLAAVISSVLVDLANSDRSANAIGGLAVSPVLTKIAQDKANDMAAKSYFAHVSPDGHDPWYWFAVEGYVYSYAGENLAVDFTDSAAVETAWMNSPEHRANLLNSHFTEIGIATAQGTYEGHATIFVAEEFGTPAPNAPYTIVASVPASPTTTAVAVATPKPKPSVAGTTTTPTKKTPAPLAHASTTTPAAGSSTPVVAVAEPMPPPPAPLPPPAPPAPLPWWASIVASPETILGYAYYALAAAILVTLAYVTELEYHRRHLWHVAAAGALLAIMLAFFVVGDLLIFSHPVLAAL